MKTKPLHGDYLVPMMSSDSRQLRTEASKNTKISWSVWQARALTLIASVEKGKFNV